MEKGKEFFYKTTNINNTFAAVLLKRLEDAGYIDELGCYPVKEIIDLTKAIGLAGMEELKRPPVKDDLIKKYIELRNTVDKLTGRTSNINEVWNWFYPQKIDYMTEKDIDNIIGKDEVITVKGIDKSDIEIAHTDYGNFIVTTDGNILGIASKEALDRLTINADNKPKDHFIEFNAYEDLAIKVDPIEEKVREQMEKESLQEHYCPNASSVSQDAKTGETTYTVNGEKHDPVYHPAHYCTKDLFYIPAECIQVSRLLSFSLGNVIKYIWRMGRKSNAVEDAKKACWYLEDAFKYPTETGNEDKALGILSVLGGNDIVDNMKIVLMQDIINAFVDGLHMDRDKEIHNRIMSLAQSIKD